MALQMNRVNSRNKADEAIKQMDSSTAAYVSELAALNNNPAATSLKPAAGHTDNPLPQRNASEIPQDVISNVAPQNIVTNVMQEKVSNPNAGERIEREGHLPIIKNTFRNEGTNPDGKKRRGRTPKAAYGEECRVQFSTTLPPEIYKQLRAESKEIGAPLSYLIERILKEHFKNASIAQTF